jgi:hypothetical protein
MNLQDFRNNQELIGALVIIFIIMATYYYYLYKEYKKTKDTYDSKRFVSICPDYWSLTSNSNPEDKIIKCKNEKNIGRCNHNIDKDFSSKLYQDDIAKCKWSKYCNAPWEGVDHLCADLTVNQLDPGK